ITDANKTKIKALRDLLVEKRIASVVMPECGDNNSMISNKSDLAKYGTFLKFVGTTTIEEVKDPNWPFPVIGHGTMANPLGFLVWGAGEPAFVAPGTTGSFKDGNTISLIHKTDGF